MRVIKWPLILGIMNFQGGKNLQNEGVTKKRLLRAASEVVGIARDVLIKILAVWDDPGVVAHFFWRLIWANKIKAFVKFEPDWRLNL